MKKLMILGSVFVFGSILALAIDARADVPGRIITGPNGAATKGALVTFTVNWPHGSIVLTCQQGTTQVLNVTQKQDTTFRLDSPSWLVGPASCHALWYYMIGGVKTTQAQLDFAVDPVPPSPTPTPTPTDPPNYTPVVLVLFENHSYSTVDDEAPYLNGLAATGRLFTHYVAIIHPSLPNYIAFTAGDILGCTKDTACAGNTLPQDNLYHQLSVAGITWQSFAENMLTPCALKNTGSGDGKYIAHHQPVIYFTNVHSECQTRSLPYAQLDPNHLAQFTFIEPSNAHNMHDGSVQAGDDWARANIQPLIDAGAEVIFTFDEGCCNFGQTVYTFVAGAGVTPSIDGASYNDYSLLAGIEDHFGLPRLLNAQTARPLPIP